MTSVAEQPATGAVPAAPAQRTPREVIIAISGLVVAMFVAVISGTVVSTSMPLIIADLGGDQTAYTWVITASLLAMATPCVLNVHRDGGARLRIAAHVAR